MTKLNPKSIIPGTITTEMLSPEVQNKLETSSGGSNVSYNPQELTEEQKEIARNNIDSQKKLTVELKTNGNIVLGGIEGGDKEFMPATPSGHPLHDSFVLAGGVWTPYDQLPDRLKDERSLANGGFWSYRVDEGGLEDITTEEFEKMFLFFNPTSYSASHQYDVGYSDGSMQIRTNISKLSTAVNVNFGYAAWFQQKMEVFFPFAKRTGSVNIMNSAWRNCKSLKRIAGEINVRSCTTVASVDNTFTNSPLLEEVRLTNIATSISFKDQKNLSNASMLHAIQNVLPTASGVVLTLHPEAYARAMADPEIAAALEVHTNISLALA